MTNSKKTICLCIAHMSEETLEQKYIKEAFDTNWVVPLGPNVNAFEDEQKKFVGENKEVVIGKGTNVVSEGIFTVGMCMPAGPCVSDEDVRYIVECIREAMV